MREKIRWMFSTLSKNKKRWNAWNPDILELTFRGYNLFGLLRDTETEKPIADIVNIVITRR